MKKTIVIVLGLNLYALLLHVLLGCGGGGGGGSSGGASKGVVEAESEEISRLEAELATCREDSDACHAALDAVHRGGGTLPSTGVKECTQLPANLCTDSQCSGQDGSIQAGCPLEGRFKDNGDGTVTDNCTGLMWQLGYSDRRFIWCEAIQYCESLDLAGHMDWRAPNIIELLSIVDFSTKKDLRMIHQPFAFPEGTIPWFWSGTPKNDDPPPASMLPPVAFAATFLVSGAALGLLTDTPALVRAVRNR